MTRTFSTPHMVDVVTITNQVTFAMPINLASLVFLSKPKCSIGLKAAIPSMCIGWVINLACLVVSCG